MATIVSSHFVEDPIEADGRWRVTDYIKDSDGNEYSYEYRCTGGDMVPSVVHQKRVEAVSRKLAIIDAANSVVAGTTIPLSKVGILRRVTAEEWEALQTSQSKHVRYFRDVFNAATNIYRNDPLTIAGFAMLEQAGVLRAGRAEEILSDG